MHFHLKHKKCVQDQSSIIQFAQFFKPALVFEKDLGVGSNFHVLNSVLQTKIYDRSNSRVSVQIPRVGHSHFKWGMQFFGNKLLALCMGRDCSYSIALTLKDCLT